MTPYTRQNKERSSTRMKYKKKELCCAERMPYFLNAHKRETEAEVKRIKKKNGREKPEKTSSRILNKFKVPISRCLPRIRYFQRSLNFRAGTYPEQSFYHRKAIKNNFVLSLEDRDDRAP